MTLELDKPRLILQPKTFQFLRFNRRLGYRVSNHILLVHDRLKNLSFYVYLTLPNLWPAKPRSFWGTKFQHNTIFGKTVDKEPLGGKSLLILIYHCYH